MQWLIALVVISLMLAPVLWMMPSKAQKRQGHLRQLAREEGLQVELSPMPQSHRQKVRREDTRMGICYYLLVARSKTWNRPQWFAWRTAPEEEARMSGEYSAALEQKLDELFAGLPRDVEALESNQRGLGVYWSERGDEQDVRDIAQTLRKLVDWMKVDNEC